MATVWHHHAAELAGWDWTAIATIVVALVTLAVAGATFMTAGATKVLAGETKKLAEHTKDLATQATLQVAEMELSRRLEWAPHLAVQPGGQEEPGGGDLVHFKATVTNIGRGPGINCLLVRFINVDHWCASGNFELGGGQSAQDMLAHGQDEPPPPFLANIGALRTVMFCRDQFGAFHMFDPPRPALVWRTGDAETDWATWYRAQVPG